MFPAPAALAAFFVGFVCGMIVSAHIAARIVERAVSP